MRRFLMASVILGAVTASCGEDSVTNVPQISYREPTSPENVLFNLQESYRRQEIEEYAKLLAPEFKFEFQPGDRGLISEEFWTRDDDSTGTSNLFRAPIVTDIRVTLTHGPADTTGEFGFDSEVRFIRVNHTFLEVDQSDGITWQVDGDIQDMFFRPGDEAQGEDPDHWFLIEWRDIPNPAGAPGESTGGDLLAIEGTTWGRIKTLYEGSESTGVTPNVQAPTWGSMKTLYENSGPIGVMLPVVESPTWGQLKARYQASAGTVVPTVEGSTWGRIKTRY